MPADAADLALFLRSLPRGEPVQFVGLGSNLLVRDGGYRGTVVAPAYLARRDAPGRRARLAPDAGVAGAEGGAFRSDARHSTARNSWPAFPGTVGGALAMNAGCYGSETWDIVAR